MLQKLVPQSSLSLSMLPYFSRSHARKLARGRRRIRVLLLVVRKLVIELPAPHALVLAELHGQRGDHLLHVVAIHRRTPVALLAPAVIHAAAHAHPPSGSRDACATSHTGGVALGVQRITLSPFFAASSTFCSSQSNWKLALLRLHERPGEFAHVDEFHAHLFDVRHVARPLLFGPRLGIVVRPDGHHVFGGKPVRGGGGCSRKEASWPRCGRACHGIIMSPRPAGALTNSPGVKARGVKRAECTAPLK